jgi:hypothetical protein
MLTRGLLIGTRMQSHITAADDGASHIELGGTNEGVDPKLFGPSVWKLLFALARAIDEYLTNSEQDGESRHRHARVRRAANHTLMRISSTLPCSTCRTSSKVFLQNPDLSFVRLDRMSRLPNGYTEFVFWLRVQVNRKLYRQQLQPALSPTDDGCGRAGRASVYRAADIRSAWREYTLPCDKIRANSITSAAALRSILTCLWWMSKSNRTRPHVISFTRDLSTLLHLLGHAGLALLLHTMWKDNGTEHLPIFGQPLRVHLDLQLAELHFTARTRHWLCVWWRDDEE